MKKYIYCLCIILCVNLGGCIGPMSRGERLTKELGSEHKMADQMMEDIATALDNGDADALKKLFSKNALQEATDIDQQISDLLNFYQGKMESFEGLLSSSTESEYGENVQKEIIGYYTLITDKETYRIAYEYVPIEKNNSDMVGLKSLEFITQEFYKDHIDTIGPYQWQASSKGPGVYMNQ